MRIQKSLVYFLTALRSNELLMMKMVRTNFLQLNEDEKEQWQFLYSTMKEEGFHYCFKHYSDFEDIEDTENIEDLDNIDDEKTADDDENKIEMEDVDNVEDVFKMEIQCF